MYSVGSLNISYGNWSEITELHILAIEKAKLLGAKLLVLPALSTTGCYLGDRFLRSETYDCAKSVIQSLLSHVDQITVVVGTILQFEGLNYQVAAVLHNKRIVAYVPRQYLDGPRDDSRYFSRFRSSTQLTSDGVPLGAWNIRLPGLENLIVHHGELQTLLTLPRGSVVAHVETANYYVGHYHSVCRNLCAYSEENAITIVHPATHGCSDGTHVTDGASIIVENGVIIAKGKRFVFGEDVVVTTPAGTSTSEATLIPDRFSRPEDIYEEILTALALGMRDYLRRAKLSKVCLALSGGRDSALVALIVWRMVQLAHPMQTAEEIKQRVKDLLICAYLPSENSSSQTQVAAHEFAEELGATCYDLSIESILSELYQTFSTSMGLQLTWTQSEMDLTMQNMQARARSLVIWTLANANNALLLTTSNMSETAVGYATMDGDTSGGLAPISSIPKTMVSHLLAWACKRFSLASLEAILAMPPSAELRPKDKHQEDEKDLMPYEVLDALIYAYVVEHRSAEEMVALLWNSFQSFYDTKSAFQNDVQHFIQLMTISQWKRERYANGFIIMQHDLFPNSGLRWPVLYKV